MLKEVVLPVKRHGIQRSVRIFICGEANGLRFSAVGQCVGSPAQVYAELTPKPIAAASLGQVYKGRLKTGETVAVKVQRPYVVETVSIDLFIIRRATAIIPSLTLHGTPLPAGLLKATLTAQSPRSHSEQDICSMPWHASAAKECAWQEAYAGHAKDDRKGEEVSAGRWAYS